MNLSLNDDQQLLQETVARLFRIESTPARVRAAEATGFDAALWAQLMELGIPLMRIPEAAGGSGLGLLDAALVTEQGGRYLASVPLAETIVANRLLAQLDGAAAPAWLQQAREGTLISFLPQALLADEKMLVPGGAVAAGVLALDGDKVLLLRGLAGQRDENTGAMPCRLAVLKGADAQGEALCLAQGDGPRQLFLAAIEEWKLLTAAMLAGLSLQALEMAAAYACQREAFGRPIGSYQGIAHPLADCLAECDGARLLIWHGIWAVATQRGEGAAAISMAYWWATQASARAVARALHTFGGYGVSLEYDIQLYYRRAKAWALLAGDPQQELARIGQRLWQPIDTPLPETGSVSLDFSCGENATRFADEARAFFAANLTDELKAKAHHSEAGYDAAFARKLAAAGLRYPHWPKAWGGREVTPYDMAALNEVVARIGWESLTGPITNQVAQVIMRLGNDALKNECLPRFAQGDTLACLGFSEPSGGSDMYAIKTRAVRDGDDWVINGQKIFTTIGNIADYILLLTRTDPELPKHKGLTVFVVPMNTPGIELQPVHTLQDERTNITYFADVRVPDKYRLGRINGGLEVMMVTMELEHGGGDQYRIGYSLMYEAVTQWAQDTRRQGRRVIDNPDTALRLARVATHTTIARALCYRAIWAIYNDIPKRAHFGPMAKVFTTEFYQRDAAELMDLAAPESLFPAAPGLEHLELGYRQSIGTTIYGGTSEILRSIVAEQGLGMPKSRG